MVSVAGSRFPEITTMCPAATAAPGPSSQAGMVTSQAAAIAMRRRTIDSLPARATHIPHPGRTGR